MKKSIYRTYGFLKTLHLSSPHWTNTIYLLSKGTLIDLSVTWNNTMINKLSLKHDGLLTFPFLIIFMTYYHVLLHLKACICFPYPYNLIKGAKPGLVPVNPFVNILLHYQSPSGVTVLLDVTRQILPAWKMKGHSRHVSRDDSFLCDEPQSHSLLSKTVTVIKDKAIIL